MTVTAHVYPKAVQAINNKTIDMHLTTAGTFLVGLCTGDASAWTSTEQAKQFVTDFTGTYTEVVTGGYARVDISTGVTMTQTNNKNVWTCTSPISFGSSITLAARSMFIFTKQVGSADASWPLIGVVDFGATVTSTAGAWTYTVDPTNGLAFWTES